MLFSVMNRSKAIPCSRGALPSIRAPSPAGSPGGRRRPGSTIERQPAAGISRPVAGLVQETERLQRLLVSPVAALGVGPALAPVRQRTDDLYATRGEPDRQIAKAVHEENRQVAPVDDVLAARGRLVDDVSEVRIQLRRPARQVHRVRARPVEGRETRSGRRPVHHLVRPVRTGVDVAMPARHVAELAEVDLEDFDRSRPQGVAPARGERASEVSPVRGRGQVHGRDRGDLLVRSGQRSTPGVE